MNELFKGNPRSNSSTVSLFFPGSCKDNIRRASCPHLISIYVFPSVRIVPAGRLFFRYFRLEYFYGRVDIRVVFPFAPSGGIRRKASNKIVYISGRSVPIDTAIFFENFRSLSQRFFWFDAVLFDAGYIPLQDFIDCICNHVSKTSAYHVSFLHCLRK